VITPLSLASIILQGGASPSLLDHSLFPGTAGEASAFTAVGGHQGERSRGFDAEDAVADVGAGTVVGADNKGLDPSATFPVGPDPAEILYSRMGEGVPLEVALVLE